MDLAKLVYSTAILFSVVMLSSCASNFPQDIPENYTSPNEHTFSVPYEKAWTGAVQAISEVNSIRVLDKENGLIVSDFDTVMQKSRTMLGTSMFGKTYKNRYSARLKETAPGKTTVQVQSLLRMKQFAISSRESNAECLEAHLRQELFRRICDNLYRDSAKCLGLFPDYNNTAVSLPPTPAVIPEEASHPDLDPMWKMEIDVKELQKALADAGYNPGPIDGLMGKKTRAALTRFQKDNNLEPTGLLDEATMIALEI